MKAISFIISGLLLTTVASVGSAQSLADLAKKEQERRQAVKATIKVITNEQAARFKSTPAAAPEPAGQPAEKTGAASKPPAEGTDKVEAVPATAKEKAATDEPVDLQGRTESFWRQTFADARKKVQDLENETNVLILKFNDLQNQFYRESDGFKQQELQRQIQKTIFEQDANKENLAAAKASLADLENEARKSGALPGWIREPGK